MAPGAVRSRPIEWILVEGYSSVDIRRAVHVNSITMGDSTPVKAAKRRLERAALAWAECGVGLASTMMAELQAAARGYRDALSAQGKPA
jgi:hypothetical protein